MNKYASIDFLFVIIFISIFFFLISGPAIPDILLTFFVLITLYFKKQIIFKDRIKLLLIFVILWIWFLVSSLFAYDVFTSLIEVIIFMRFILFIFISYLIFKDLNLIQIKYILFFIFFCCIFVAIDTFYQFYNYSYLDGFGKDIFGRKPEGIYGRLSGPFSDLVPGSYLSRLLFFVLFIYVIDPMIFYNKKLNFLYSASIVIIISAIYFSGERMAFATTLLGLFLCIIFLKKLRKILFFISIISGLFIYLNIYLHPHYNNYQIIQSNAQHEGLIIEREFICNNNIKCSKEFKLQPKFFEILKDFDNSAYGEIYLSAFYMWKDYKFFGIGLNNFNTVCINENKYKKYNQNYGCTTHPHNIYIQALVETGIIGFLIFIVLIIIFFIKILKIQDSNYKVLLLSSFLTIFWPIMSTGSFLKNWNMVFISIVLTLILILMNVKYKKN